MFESLLFIALPVLFILCGAVAALSFARDPEETEAASPEATLAVKPAATAALPAAELFRPREREAAAAQEELTFDELIASLETHLRTEREAAKAFIHRPSAAALWVN